MDSILVALVSAGATVIVAVIGVYTARLAKRGARDQAQIEAKEKERATILEGYDRFNEDLAKRNEYLNTVADKLRDRVDAVEENQVELRARIADLEEKRITDRLTINLLVEYSRRLIVLLEERGIQVPPVPVRLVEYGLKDND